ncbi:MAG TPA: hypothetical protein VKX35_02900 [Fermentimonas sp.]|nr:hypothetical protein [Fermentimonas sp.]
MSDNRKIYIDQLLRDLKELEENLNEVKDSDSMPFAFFRESFSKTQEISLLLHKLEFIQVEEMKNQMEKLVFFLSETEKKVKDREIEIERVRRKEIELDKEFQEARKYEEIKEESQLQEIEKEIPSTIEVKEEKEVVKTYTEGFTLPEYKNPYSNNSVPKAASVPPTPPPSIIDFKKVVSINDRFLFQRELFNNNSQLMNNTIDKLNSVKSYEEAVKHIRENFTWDFESPTVNDFLTIISNRFK